MLPVKVEGVHGTVFWMSFVHSVWSIASIKRADCVTPSMTGIFSRREISSPIPANETQASTTTSAQSFSLHSCTSLSNGAKAVSGVISRKSIYKDLMDRQRLVSPQRSIVVPISLRSRSPPDVITLKCSPNKQAL